MMNILEELELVRGRLTKPDKVDPNAIFAELEKQHTNKPRLQSDKVVEEVILLFNRRTEENMDIEVDDTILEEDDKSIISLGDSDTCLESVEESLNLGLNPDQGLLDLVNNNEPNNNQDMDASWNLVTDESVGAPEPAGEIEDPIRAGLIKDTNKVLRLIKNDGVEKSFEEVLAYLENFVYNENRVQLVVEELVGLQNPLQDPEPEPEPVEPQIMYKGKGKGVKGKKSKNCGKFVKKSSGLGYERDDPGTPDELPDPHLDQTLPEVLPEQTGFSSSFTISSGSSSSERSYGSQAISPDIPDELPEKLHDKLPQLNQTFIIKPKKEKARKSTEPRAVKRKTGDLEEHMLHGPFNFKAHRAPGVKQEKTSSNLRDELITVVMQAGRKPAKVAKTNSVEIIEDDIKPVVSAEPEDPEVLVISPIPPAPAPPVLTTPDLAAPAPSVRAPPVAPAPIAAQAPPAAISNKEIDDLVGNLCEMFQDTDPLYIRLRAEDLVGKPAALERFTMELIQDPTPPVNWRQIYSIPLHQNDDIQVQTPPPPPPPPQLSIQERNNKPSTPPVLTDHMEEIHLPGISKIKTEIGSRAQTPVLSGSWMRTPSEGGSRSQTPSEGGSRSQTPSDGGSRAQTPVQDRSRNPTPAEDLGEVELDPQEELEKEMMIGWRSLFPDLCPDWIQDQIYQIVRSENKTIQELQRLFQTKVEGIFSLPAEARKSLPTYKDWEKKQRELKELQKWSGQMTVSDMLDLFQDPVAYFTDPSREMKDEGYKQQCVVALKEAFRYHSSADVEKALRQGQGLFALSFKILKNRPNSRKTKRSDHEVRHVVGPPCIHLLKEKKFVELEEMIKIELKNREERRLEMIEEARTAGILVECSCCYSDECLDEDMISCNNNHMFCKECVSRGASVAIGDGKTIIECLGMCSEEISWQELQRALTPNVLSKLLQKRQAAEVATAGLEGIVTCPFCPYMTIMDDENDKVLVCKNPDCGRESCRLCKEPSHVPLRCEEVESRDEETQRKKIEEKLSQAMIRECHKCKTKYFKEEGCNKMTCPKKGCGAKMCYLCKEPVQGYEHFYGQGGSPGKGKKCPLWSDSKSLHEKEIAVAAQEARAELAENNITLKDSVDPTKGIPDPSTIKQKDPFPGIAGGGVGGQYGGLMVQPELMGMMARMGEIYRIREAGRAHQRLARIEEERALRDLRRNQWVHHQPQPVQYHYHPYPPPPQPNPPHQPLPPAPQQLINHHPIHQHGVNQIGVHHMYNPVQTHPVHHPVHHHPAPNQPLNHPPPPPQPNAINDPMILDPHRRWDYEWRL